MLQDLEFLKQDADDTPPSSEKCIRRIYFLITLLMNPKIQMNLNDWKTEEFKTVEEIIDSDLKSLRQRLVDE